MLETIKRTLLVGALSSLLGLTNCACASIENEKLIGQLDALQQFMERTGAAGEVEIIIDPSGHVGIVNALELRTQSRITGRIQFNARGGE